jgi:hypothetical protein
MGCPSTRNGILLAHFALSRESRIRSFSVKFRNTSKETVGEAVKQTVGRAELMCAGKRMFAIAHKLAFQSTMSPASEEELGLIAYHRHILYGYTILPRAYFAAVGPTSFQPIWSSPECLARYDY